MADKAPFEIPIGMRRVCRRFETLAEGTQGSLTDSGVIVGFRREWLGEHGVFQNAKVLRLEYGKLKRMAESDPAPVRPTLAPARFLELVSPQRAPCGPRGSECWIELEGPRGKTHPVERGHGP